MEFEGYLLRLVMVMVTFEGRLLPFLTWLAASAKIKFQGRPVARRGKPPPAPLGRPLPTADVGSLNSGVSLPAMLLQPFIDYNFPDAPGRYLSLPPIITANWEATEREN